jgi:hypothetical protein
MGELKKLLKDFGENGLTDKVNENGVPGQFVEIACSILSGCFEIVGQDQNAATKIVRVIPTTVEIYCHDENDSGEKDRIVYHKNAKNAKTDKPYFSIGLLHNHVSGIDITFESSKHRLRSSALIRGFRIENVNSNILGINIGKEEDKSTHLYEALFSQFNIFDGFSIHWIDDYKKVNESDITPNVRKNVAEYENKDGKYEKKKLKDYPGKDKTENGEYVQDMRLWSFTSEKGNKN